MYKNFQVTRSLSRRQFVATWLFLSIVLVSSAFAQQPVLTNRDDNSRSGAYTGETLLTPSNVNTGTFGHLFSVPVDYQVLAQPLYVPNVNIGGQLHNVVYVVTQMDSVYAIDADNGGSPLWTASMLNGGVVASGQYLPCGTLGGFNHEGIISTPVIDLTTTPNPTMYLVAKTVFNGAVQHNLHALDITTGADLPGSPVLITGSSISKKNTPATFNSLHQKNRPGLLLLNGILYLGFGSNGCNDHNSGWVMAYDAVPADQTYLGQLGVFNTSPDIGLTSIWQTGTGLAGDSEGNVYASTAESVNYDVANGGQSYSNSVLKLTPPPWTPQNQVQGDSQPAAYFTPSNVTFLNSNDLDLSSGGVVILPDQNGPGNCSQNPCHEALAGGKSKQVYVLDRDNMGGFDNGIGGTDEDLQEFGLTGGGNGLLMCSPAYWNGTVYYSVDGAPLQSFQLSNGLLSPSTQTTQKLIGASAPAISANGNTNGIAWVLTGYLKAFDAVSLKLLYTSTSKVPKLAHFATPTVANGKVYVATQTSLEAYGLLNVLTVTGGNNQTAQVLNPLPAPLQILATNSYTGQPVAGATLTFCDGKKGGSFNPPTAVTGSDGAAQTSYTFGQKSGNYTLTASSPGFGSVTASETATPAAASILFINSGNRQTGAAGTVLPNSLIVVAQDTYKNPVPGVSVKFTPVTQGSANPTSAFTNARGWATTNFTLPTTTGAFTITASSSGLKNVIFSETSIAGPPASVTVSGGNNQIAPAGTTLPQALTVVVADQYGNPTPGIAVGFDDGGAFGSFGNPNPMNTDSSGTAIQTYTLPANPGSVTITASVPGAANSAIFTETGQ